jgi:hypothetical protein
MPSDIEYEIAAIANERGLDCMDRKVRAKIRRELRLAQLRRFHLLPLVFLKWLWGCLSPALCLFGCPGSTPGGHPGGGDHDWVQVTSSCPRCGKTTTTKHYR